MFDGNLPLFRRNGPSAVANPRFAVADQTCWSAWGQGALRTLSAAKYIPGTCPGSGWGSGGEEVTGWDLGADMCVLTIEAS